MSEQLLELLKLGLLALLYLFFLRVLWAVATQLRTPAVLAPRRREARGRSRPRGAQKASRPAASRPAPATRLVIQAPASLAGTHVELFDGLTIGRGADNVVVIDDAYISQTHGRVFRGESGWLYEDLGSTNGSQHNGARVTSPVPLHPGDGLQLGDAVLEAR